MNIIASGSEQSILKELGARIKRYRINLNLKQSELADRCGVSSSTLVRIENGEDSKISNYIKILGGLKIKQNFDLLIPELQDSFKEIYEQKNSKQRVRTKKTTDKKPWIWEEDK